MASDQHHPDVLPVDGQEVVHVDEVRPHVVGVHEGRELHEHGFARDVVDEVQPHDHRDRVDRHQTQEAPNIEAPDLQVSPIFRYSLSRIVPIR